MSKNTVEKYLDLLSKVFVIYRLGAYSTNQRNEVSKAGKWYFYDNGIRNAIIGNFQPLSARQDVGALWESYLIAERIKKNNYLRLNNEVFFWRAYRGKEVDLVEVDEHSVHVLHVVCDLSIASENAIFGQTGPRVGSFDAGFGSSYLARVVGQKKAREIWFLCRQYSAAEALEMGLVNTVVPFDQLEDETVKWCKEMMNHSPLALRMFPLLFRPLSDFPLTSIVA